jgi:hypothetical protein
MSTTPYKYTISGSTYQDKLFGNLSNVSIANAFRNIGKHYEGVAIGANSEQITLNGGPAKATGTITIAVGNMANNDTITINSVVLTAKTSPSGTSQFGVGSTALQTGINLTACIKANPKLSQIVTASYAKSSTSAVITLTAAAIGTVGNYSWSQSGSNVTLAPSLALGGGTNGPIAAANVFTISAGNLSANDTVTIGTTTYTAVASGPTAIQFVVGGSARITANNLAALINTNTLTSVNFTAVSSGTSTGIVSITSNIPGTIGNNISVSKSATNGTWTGTTFFIGGLDAKILTLHKGI